MTAKVPTIDSGSVIDGTSVARPSAQKDVDHRDDQDRATRPASAPTVGDGGADGLAAIERDDGADTARHRRGEVWAAYALMRSMTAMMLAPGWRRMIKRTRDGRRPRRRHGCFDVLDDVGDVAEVERRAVAKPELVATDIARRRRS